MPARLLTASVFALSSVLCAASSPLVSSPSAFVRAQAGSKVAWHPWDEASLAAARASGKSVYVFIGSPLSELSRATLTQTFGSDKTADWVNENFHAILVDAEAEPEVAAFGQHFINTVKQLRGLPVHLWLLADDLRPYDGANYLPPSEEWGKPGFLKAARAALDNWAVDPGRARALAAEAAELMRLPDLPAADPVDRRAKLASAAAGWVAAADPVHGGFGTAPKQPEPELIRFLLGRGGEARQSAIAGARALVTGSLRDPSDGGFWRRCIDEAWKEPYRQKTLADQARLALALFDAAEAAGDASLRAAGVAALDFALKELRLPDGTFAAALDGTLEAGPAGRLGVASTAARALLAVALHRSGEKRHADESARLAAGLKQDPVPHQSGAPAAATAADLLAAALALRANADAAAADRLVARANSLYFDAASGTYQASRSEPPPGIAQRVPASGETPSAEVLALLAGVDEGTAAAIRRGLLVQVEYDDQPPGEILLGLAAGEK